jgi:hypothetical protein
LFVEECLNMIFQDSCSHQPLNATLKQMFQINYVRKDYLAFSASKKGCNHYIHAACQAKSAYWVIRHYYKSDLELKQKCEYEGRNMHGIWNDN